MRKWRERLAQRQCRALHFQRFLVLEHSRGTRLSKRARFERARRRTRRERPRPAPRLRIRRTASCGLPILQDLKSRRKIGQMKLGKRRQNRLQSLKTAKTRRTSREVRSTQAHSGIWGIRRLTAIADPNNSAKSVKMIPSSVIT